MEEFVFKNFSEDFQEMIVVGKTIIMLFVSLLFCFNVFLYFFKITITVTKTYTYAKVHVDVTARPRSIKNLLYKTAVVLVFPNFETLKKNSSCISEQTDVSN